MQTKASVLAAKGIGKTVRSGEADLVILRDIDLAVTPGEALAVVGASGSGKSTLLALLAGLDTPSTGTVLLDGVDLFSLDEDRRAQLRGRVLGFVFQSFQLLPALTALENVMLPLELIDHADPRQAAGAVLAEVGLAARLGHYPNQLSGGEQQRVAIARAFAAGPKLLFADEPTGNLDAATGARVADLLFDLNRRLGTTLVIVTHDAALAARSDREIRLGGGKVVGETVMHGAAAASAASIER